MAPGLTAKVLGSQAPSLGGGGCFVPFLMFVLWMTGAFAPKCPAPGAKKQADVQAKDVAVANSA